MAVVNPSVACVILVNGRESMTKRAIASFRAQTYENKRLLLYDTGENYYSGEPLENETYFRCFWNAHRGALSIGQLRNEAIAHTEGADIIVTMDSDDYSAPQRIEEQVRLLEASAAEAVGYNEALFWDASRCTHCAVGGEALKDGAGTGWHCVSAVLPLVPCPSLAYLYSNPRPNYAIGASLAFWRSTWLRRPFPHLPEPGNKQCGGEDAAWLEDVFCVGVSAFPAAPGEIHLGRPDMHEPRIICSVHADNSQRYDLALSSPQFKRYPQFDDFAREKMKL